MDSSCDDISCYEDINVVIVATCFIVVGVCSTFIYLLCIRMTRY